MFESIVNKYVGVISLTHLAQSIVNVKSDLRYRQLTESFGRADSITLDYYRKFKCEFAVMSSVLQGNNLATDLFTISIKPYETYSFTLSTYEKLLLLYFYNRDIYTDSFLCSKFYGEMNMKVFEKLVNTCQKDLFLMDEELSDLEKMVFCYHFIVDVEHNSIMKVSNFLNSEVIE